MDKTSTLNYIADRFHLDFGKHKEMPIMIPDTNRISLARLFNGLRFKEGAEIGVRSGRYSKILCDNIRGLRLHCVDPWEMYSEYRNAISSQEKFQSLEKRSRDILARYNCNFIKKYSMDAINDIPDRSLDFVYIDANHDIRYFVDDITEWSKKVKKGGIVSGHDYFVPDKNHNEDIHVMYALRAYVAAWKIVPWFVLGREEKVPGEKRDEARSWFFVV